MKSKTTVTPGATLQYVHVIDCGQILNELTEAGLNIKFVSPPLSRSFTVEIKQIVAIVCVAKSRVSAEAALRIAFNRRKVQSILAQRKARTK